MDKIAEWAEELQSLAQAGLYYAEDVFDRERFERIRQIAAEMMAERTGLPLGKVTELFCADSGYQTPKVDTRAAVFRDGKILLVQERDGRWALPGGWCEFNLTPAENAVKEAREEAGLDVAVKSLIAVQDRDRHNRPPYPFHIVKHLLPLRGARRRIPGKQRDARQRLFPARRAAPARRGEMLRRTGPPVLRRPRGGELARRVRLIVGFTQRACFFDGLPV